MSKEEREREAKRDKKWNLATVRVRLYSLSGGTVLIGLLLASLIDISSKLTHRHTVEYCS